MITKEYGFLGALHSGRIKEIRSIPKADLHNHCLMGGRKSDIEKFAGKKLAFFHPVAGNIQELDQWIEKEYRPVLENFPDAFENAVGAAFLQAKRDGVTILESSIDSGYGTAFRIPPEKIVATLKRAHQTIAPDIDFRPELGFIRGQSIRSVMVNMEPFLDFNFFKSIDLYDDELSQPIRNFREIYRFAKSIGMKCKAHVGEFGTADAVKEAVEELGLDAVQHGIAAATSPSVMKWLASHQVRLNICPASNIRMKLARSYKTHPIRILFDHGVKVTINTDDVLLFGQGTSEQYLKLFNAGVFSGDELDIIRKNGLDPEPENNLSKTF